MKNTAWPREYLGRLAVATVGTTLAVFVGVWLMFAIAGGDGVAYLVAPGFALVGTFLVGSYTVLTGPEDTPPWPFALILGGAGGVFVWLAWVVATRG